MSHTTFELTSVDGLKLFARGWLASQTNSKGVVYLVHGIGEHTGRYDHLGKSLSENGYHLIGIDLRGHGLSEGKRGHTPSFEDYFSDIKLLMAESRSRFGSQPSNFLYGHSLGGNIVLNFGLQIQPELTGVIASAPALKLAYEPPKIKLLLGKVMEKLFPSLTMSNTLDVEALSRDHAIVQAYRDDVLVHDQISAKLAMEMFKCGHFALEHASSWDLPMLLMHGTADRLTSHQASQNFAESAGEQVELVLWQDYYHEIHNDYGKEEVIEKMISWLEQNTN